ncbi:hypothetical protein CEXT_121331 [Caerostris extrusa]|uniref:Uncharacterized protein n=1 Tax=Caerostris extrusa TaxID=172846 RepID=A0AAV4TS71_CAEEX|nr:hypothetical protein CEXT_121331 [Caerostris extrusa]
MPIVATTIGSINVTVMAKSQMAKEIATKTLTVLPDGGAPEETHQRPPGPLSRCLPHEVFGHQPHRVARSTLQAGEALRTRIQQSRSLRNRRSDGLVFPLDTESMLGKPGWCGEQNMFDFCCQSVHVAAPEADRPTQAQPREGRLCAAEGR